MSDNGKTMASLEEKVAVNDEAPSTVSYTQEEERALRLARGVGHVL